MSLSSEPTTFPSFKTFYESTQQKRLMISEGTIQVLKNTIIKLQDQITCLSKENSDLKTRNALNDYAKEELTNANKKIKELEEKNLNILEKNYLEQKHLKHKIENLNSLKEKEEKEIQNTMEIFNQKNQILNQMELENKANKEEIKILKRINEKLKNENDIKFQKQKVRNEIKFTKLKKRMTDNLNETKKNVFKLNMEYIDVNNRLSILQNNQLLIQIELQAEKIKELENQNKNLKDKIIYLENELQIHKNVEIKLVKKIKRPSLSRSLLNKNLKGNNSVENLSSNLFNHNSFKSNIQVFNENNNRLFINYRKKIYSLENEIKIKNNEIENLKLQISEYKIKLSKYEEKYKGLFNFFEVSLNKFYDDEEIKKKKNLYINIESIKKCDFSIFSKEEQYNLLILIMKYLLPIINLNFNANCNVGNDIFETNLNVINNDFNKTENYLKEPTFYQAFNKNNKMRNIYHSKSLNSIFTKSIPIMKREKTKQNHIISDSKYKAVFNI